MLGRIRRLTKLTGEGEVSLTPRSEKAVQMACLEARQVGRYHVDTEHLLLGLARDLEGGAARVLADLGISYEDVRRKISETSVADR